MADPTPRRHVDPATPDLPRLRRRLLAWYRRAARDLPWRRRPGEPYAQWLAEMMLQQTQTGTVIPYYERFLGEFPTVAELAAAPRERVLALWAGLGYYRRAHALHDAAQMVMREFDGEFPNTVEGLRTLPGIGPYTAGAIASIAFNRRAAILDGNVARVLARLFCIAQPPEEPGTRRRLWDLAEAVLPTKHCSSFNQALMDLGATICTPTSPRCEACPLQELCGARSAGTVDRIPPPKRRAAVQSLKLQVIVVGAGDRVLLHRRPDTGLWAGMWALPSCVENGLDLHEALRGILPPGVMKSLGEVARIGEVSHQLTHRAVRFDVFAGRARPGPVPARFRWQPVAEVTLPTAFRKVLALRTEQSPQ